MKIKDGLYRNFNQIRNKRFKQCNKTFILFTGYTVTDGDYQYQECLECSKIICKNPYNP